MKRTTALVIAFTLVLGAAGIGFAESASRPATKKDLSGTWELVSVRPVLDRQDPVFFPYQRFQFNADSSMKFIASEKPFTKEWLDKFAKQPSEIDFSLSDKGLLTLTWQSTDHSESAICAFVLRDISPEILAKIPVEKRKGLPKKGNVTLSYLNKNGRIAYQKVLTKVL